MKKTGSGGKRGVKNVRRPLLSGRHLLAAEKPLTKFAISLGTSGPDCATGPDPEDRCLGGPTARGGPGRASHRGRKSPGFFALLRRLPAHGRTNARAHSTHVHIQQKEAVRAACGGFVRSRKPLPRPPTARPRACSLTRVLLWVRGSQRPAGAGSSGSPGRLCSAQLPGGARGGAGPSTRATPRRCSARR